MQEEKIPKQKPHASFNRRLSVAEKLNIIKYAEENSIHASSNLYGVSRTIIRYWMKQKEELMKVINKLNTITLHHGKLALPIAHKNEILDFVLYNRALGNVVTSNEIIYKL